MKIKITGSTVIVVALAIGIALVLYGFIGRGEEIGRLKEANSTFQSEINEQRAIARTLELSYDSLGVQKAFVDSVVAEARASTYWWFRQAIASENKLADILSEVFVGSDSTLAIAIYNNYRSRTGN